MIFSLVGRNDHNTTLNTATAFTSLSLFALLSEPLASLVMALATFLGAAGSFSRIQQFLQSDERSDVRKSEPPMLEEKLDSKMAADAIVVQDGSFGWDPEKEPLLKDLTMAVPWHKFTMVVGPVGCGKSTLLLSLLGEVPTMDGSVSLRSTNIAYCAQKPWHMNGTIREAILGKSPFDKRWYDRVVTACALLRDLKELPLGDLSPIGSGGTALSGGQSQRIVSRIFSRARCLHINELISETLRHWHVLFTTAERSSSWMTPLADWTTRPRTTFSTAFSVRAAYFAS
jgi:ATP-binding cassette subfamily C (CFTR/MRP) protein 1